MCEMGLLYIKTLLLLTQHDTIPLRWIRFDACLAGVTQGQGQPTS